MLDLNIIRKLLAEELMTGSNIHYSFDTALSKAAKQIYQQGVQDGLKQLEKENNDKV